MNHYAGIDVSLEASSVCVSVCVIDGSGKIVCEAKVASEPEALIAWFGLLWPQGQKFGRRCAALPVFDATDQA